MCKERNATIIFEEDVRKEQLDTIPKDFKGLIHVHGDMYLDNVAELNGSFQVYGKVQKSEDEDIVINGDLVCEGEIQAWGLEVKGNLMCKEISCNRVRVYGDLFCRGDIRCFYLKISNKLEFTGKQIECNDGGYIEAGAFIPPERYYLTGCSNLKVGCKS